MKILIAALLSAALIGIAPNESTPVNNLEVKSASITQQAEQPVPSTEHPAEIVKLEKTAEAVEAPATQTPAPQPEPIQEPAQVPESVKPTPEPKPVPAPAAVPTDKQEIMIAAGIPRNEWAAVDYIVSKESTWRSNVWNSTGSGAYGLCQALPASKMASAGDDYMTNPVTQLKWCNQYAKARYGSWWSAHSFWTSNHWW